MAILSRCLIADDEAPAHFVLEAHLRETPGLLCTGHAFTGVETLQLLQQEPFELVFLDINMPVITGLEVLKNIPKRPAVIITTAYENFAFDAYQLDVVDYLLKPISLPRFLKAIEKARPFLNPQVVSRQLRVLVKGEMQTLLTDELGFLESLGNYVRIHFITKQRPLTVYGSLRELLDQLPEDRFVQIHKSYLVNLAAIHHQDATSIRLSSGEVLPVGRKFQLLLTHKQARH